MYRYLYNSKPTYLGTSNHILCVYNYLGRYHLLTSPISSSIKASFPLMNMTCQISLLSNLSVGVFMLWCQFYDNNNFDLSHHLTAIKDNEPNLFWMRLKNSFVQILLGPIYFIGTFLPYILMSRLYNSELLSADTKLLQLWSLKSSQNLWHPCQFMT